jgi:2-aminophenol/2-amino-5-chlorophenol 1,6-dioxygenase subunit alpha
VSGAWGSRKMAEEQGSGAEAHQGAATIEPLPLVLRRSVAGALLLPGAPHLLAEDPAQSWRELAAAAWGAGEEIRAAGVDALLMMSTQWFTVLGHQFQARPVLEGTYVDENWYDFDYGTFAYRFETHPELVRGWASNAEDAGFQARLTDYEGFPVDTGTLVARRLLDPEGTLPVALMSCNLYVEPGEMASLGAAGAMAAEELGLRVAVVAVSGLSGGWTNRWITPAEDKIGDPQHDEWNRRMLSVLADEGAARTLELREEYAVEAEVDGQFRALDFLSGATGGLPGPADVRAYGPVWGTGAAVVKWSFEESEDGR